MPIYHKVQSDGYVLTSIKLVMPVTTNGDAQKDVPLMRSTLFTHPPKAPTRQERYYHMLQSGKITLSEYIQNI